jgi:hypothetical protein
MNPGGRRLEVEAPRLRNTPYRPGWLRHVGIGLLYQQGHFRQDLGDNGWQLEARRCGMRGAVRAWDLRRFVQQSARTILSEDGEIGFLLVTRSHDKT